MSERKNAPSAGAVPEHGPTRAREALIVEALVDCGHLLIAAKDALNQARRVAQDIEQATAAMAEQRKRLDETIALYGQTLNKLDKSARERFTATVVEQTRQAIEQARAELRRHGQQEQQLVANAAVAAVAAVNAGVRAQPGIAPLPAPRSLVQRYLDWCGTPWGQRATLFMSVLAALLVYSSGILSRT